MKIFVDSANLKEIEESLKRGFASGITTNPSILSKEERRDFATHIRDIIAMLRAYDSNIPLSVELFTTDPHQMMVQADLELAHEENALHEHQSKRPPPSRRGA